MNNSLPMYLVPAFQKITYAGAEGKDSTFGVEFLARWVANGKAAVPSDIRLIDWVETDNLMLTTLIHGFDFHAAPFKRMFINSSNDTFADDKSFAQWLSLLVKLRQCSSKIIIVEITEQITPKNLFNRWETLKANGFEMALDDFGAYYSNIGRLQAYDWAYCKFDESQSFSFETSKAIEYCKIHKIAMIAECIEDVKMQKIARARGLINQQGYYHHKPELISFKTHQEVHNVSTF